MSNGVGLRKVIQGKYFDMVYMGANDSVTLPFLVYVNDIFNLCQNFQGNSEIRVYSFVVVVGDR